MGTTDSTGAEQKKLPSIAFAGGGTAGHVFPGLAVAVELDARIVWIGSTAGVEKKLVAEAGIAFHGIPAGKLRRYLSLRNFSDLLRTVAGVFASVRILRRERPALLFSKGGFVSVPPVVAAWLCGIPSWTHESDFDPGLATRINLRFCEKVLVSLPETARYIPERYRAKVVVSGNPVRRALYAADPAQGREFVHCPAGVKIVFVIGGSLGSAFINGLIASSRPLFPPGVFIIHQTGASEQRAVDTDPRYFPAPFFHQELPDIMAAADLIVSRAGANTLAEIAALGKPSLLIPLPQTASRGDQLRNAEVFRAAGAAVVLPEQEARPESFARAVVELLEDGERRATMGRCAATLAVGRPAQTIANLIRTRLA